MSTPYAILSATLPLYLGRVTVNKAAPLSKFNRHFECQAYRAFFIADFLKESSIGWEVCSKQAGARATTIYK